jgi:hypothetical protein
VVLVNIHLIGHIEGLQFTLIGFFIHTWSSMLKLRSTEIQLIIMCKFESTIHEENWIYMFPCLMRLFSKSVVNSGIRLHSEILPDSINIGQAQIFQQRAGILSVTTCILFSGRIYGILIVCGLCECMSSISCNTTLF